MSTQKQKLKGILSGKIDLINRSAFQFRIDCETLVEECERLHKDIKIIKNNIAALKPSNQGFKI